MGALSIAQTDRLYWLGRYLERVMLTLSLSTDIYDLMLDGVKDYDVHSLCERLGIPDVYEDSDDFINKFLFDAEDPNSVIANLNRAFDNAVVIRDCIHSETLCYIQLALNTLRDGGESSSPILEIQQVLDYLFAFWGAIEEYVLDVKTRYIIRTGRSIERMDLSVRLRIRDEMVHGESVRMINRIYRSGMNYDPDTFQRLTECFEKETWQEHIEEVLYDLEHLFDLP